MEPDLAAETNLINARFLGVDDAGSIQVSLQFHHPAIQVFSFLDGRGELCIFAQVSQCCGIPDRLEDIGEFHISDLFEFALNFG